MHSLPTRLQTLLDTVNHCSQQLDSTAYLYGDTLLCQLTGNEELLLNKEINIVISHDFGFNVQELHQRLIQHIVVNREIESSNTRYYIATMEFELKMELVHQFDPTCFVQVKQFGRFNVDTLFRDLSNQELRHPPEISDDISTLVNINDPEEWDVEDILGFVRKIGTSPETDIDKNQEQRLKNISLATIQESTNISWDEEIEDILLSRHPGSALWFLAETFVDGMPWIFKTLVDYMISLDAPINDESTIETVFNEKKLEMVNEYNDYFLKDKTALETSGELNQRLTTTLKLLFDSPNITVSSANINRITAMSAGDLGRCCLGNRVGASIGFFGCGEDIEEEECLGLPIFCEGGNPCLKDHPSFTHIPENNWQFIPVTNREWCPDQVCPDANNIHCLPPISSSSSSGSSSSGSSSSSSSSSSSEAISSSSSSKAISSSSSSSSEAISSSSSSEAISSSSSEAPSSSSSSKAIISSSSSSTFIENCLWCPESNSSLSVPTTAWKTGSGSIQAPHGCYTFTVQLESGRTYSFRTCPIASAPAIGANLSTGIFVEYEDTAAPPGPDRCVTPASTFLGNCPAPTPPVYTILTVIANYTGIHYVTVSAGIWYESGSFVMGYRRDVPTGSSIRWKTNISAIENPLDKINRLFGVFYDWDAAHGGKHDIGMIAEEVGKVLPEIVTYEENGIDAQGMYYEKLVPLLVEAIKELHAEKNNEIEKIRKQIKELEHLIKHKS